MDRETTTNKIPGQLSTKLHLRPKKFVERSLMDPDKTTNKIMALKLSKK
jgi:hypothetical protein